jgi:hypothetical protein
VVTTTHPIHPTHRRIRTLVQLNKVRPSPAPAAEGNRPRHVSAGVVQILVVLLFLASGILLLSKREVAATPRRVLRGTPLKALGLGSCLLAALPVVLDVLLGTSLAIGSFLVASTIAIVTSEPTPANEGAADPRPRASRGRQLVGAACVRCSESILVDAEARACPTCKKPVHHECVSAHRSAAHRKKRAAKRVPASA